MSSGFMTDLSGIYATGLEAAAKTAAHNVNKKQGQDMDMEDFLSLMVESLKNQTIDNQTDMSDMLNQMVQMSVMTAITSINERITQSTNLTNAVAMVGKEVTVNQQVGSQSNPIRGTVTGTGMVDGEQVIFIGDQSYFMSDILAVGRLPGDGSGAAASSSGTGGTAGSSGGSASLSGVSGTAESGFRVTDAEPEGT